jgi:glycine betaine transporter
MEVSLALASSGWGLHAWAIYGLVALSLAYFQFRKGARGLISSAFYPLLGDRINGPIGKD